MALPYFFSSFSDDPSDEHVDSSAQRPKSVVGDGAKSPDVEMSEGSLAAVLTPVIDRFPPARRRAALLRWRFGLSYAEIAEALETSVASVTMHIGRAREAVRPVVERYLSEE